MATKIARKLLEIFPERAGASSAVRSPTTEEVSRTANRGRSQLESRFAHTATAIAPTRATSSSPSTLLLGRVDIGWA